MPETVEYVRWKVHRLYVHILGLLADAVYAALVEGDTAGAERKVCDLKAAIDHMLRLLRHLEWLKKRGVEQGG
jgi:hypothetical protein